jgi:hypothetical protein
MEAQAQANFLIAEFSLAVLAEVGHKLDMDVVTAIAKASALIAVKHLIANEKLEAGDHPYWEEVKQYIESYGKDQ